MTRQQRKTAARDMEAEIRAKLAGTALDAACVDCSARTPISTYIEGVDPCQCKVPPPPLAVQAQFPAMRRAHEAGCRRPRCPRCHARRMFGLKV